MNTWNWKNCAVAFGLGAGFIAPIIGSIVTVISWFRDPVWHHVALHQVGTTLFVLTLPLLVLGAHCLDLLEKEKKRAYGRRIKLGGAVVFVLLTTGTGVTTQAQTTTERVLLERIERLEQGLAAAAERERQLLERLDRLEQPQVAPKQDQQSPAPSPISGEDRSVLDALRDTSINVTMDGYYGYNFNRPSGGINVLRAYDVASNSFSLNQATVVIENTPNLEKGKRYGVRLDLQYGQATETVQGNAANELRPQVYRPVWQAYGTYIFDVGKGLTVDFGKFASALGYETNYTKDNFNYSRAYFFNFLPFYHFGFRSSYAFNKKLTLTHWLVNGVQQSEDFNGFKSQALLLTWKPAPRVTSQFNYYNGQEQRDRNPVVRPSPSGRFHVLDTYHTFNVNDKLTLAIEGDYVIGRVFRDSVPATVWGGVGYARYQWTPKFAVAGRVEYLSERASPAGALFTGVSQALKEHTLTAEYKFADGFLGRVEYRRDFSNQPFFLTEQPGILKKEQNTATLGLVWWFGRKTGTW